MSGERRLDEGPPDLLPVEAPVEDAAAEATEPRPPSGLTLHESETAAPAEPPPDELEALRQERDQLREQLLRRRADFENYRRRVERDRQQAAQEALAGLLRELVPTLDNLDRALEVTGSEASVRDGVDLIRRQLLGVLESQGVAAEHPLGKKFDPLRHQALSHEPAPGFEEGAVVEVYRKGYSFRDRLLRPALVKVAAGDSSAGESGEGQLH